MTKSKVKLHVASKFNVDQLSEQPPVRHQPASSVNGEHCVRIELLSTNQFGQTKIVALL